MRIISFRPSPFDEIGARRVRANRMIMSIVAGMVLLAMLAVAGWVGSSALTRNWGAGSDATLTILIPNHLEKDEADQLGALAALFIGQEGVRSVQILTAQQVAGLTRRWLGVEVGDLFISAPTAVAVHITGGADNVARFEEWLVQKAPDIIVENHALWAAPMKTLAQRLDLCARVVLLVVVVVTIGVIVMVTHSALSSQRELIHIVYQLGATDSYIAQRIANRRVAVYFVGGVVGSLFAFPILFVLAAITMDVSSVAATLTVAPPPFFSIALWFLPLILPSASAVIGYVSMQVILRIWLHQVPG
jgi:cell division transport system permease protein